MKMCPNCDACFDDSTQFCPQDGSKLLEIAMVAKVETGEIIDSRYEIESEIGKGGIGTVYRAIQLSTGRRVAVKVIHPILAKQSSTIKNFQQEVRAATRLNHPGIVEILDFGLTSSGLLYLVMEYVEGEHLKKVISEIGALSVELSVSIMKQILRAVAAAHHAGMIHRDLKPSNIILLKHGKPNHFIKILDFGISKIHSHEGGAGVLNTVGSPYMAPEQVAQELATPSSDIYSLGVIFYEMLSGVLPFPTDTSVSLLGKQSTHKPVPINKLKPYLKIPGRVERIVFKAMEKEPSRRYRSSEHFLKDLINSTSKGRFILKLLIVILICLSTGYFIYRFYPEYVHTGIKLIEKVIFSDEYEPASDDSVSAIAKSKKEQDKQDRTEFEKAFKAKLAKMEETGKKRPIKEIMYDMIRIPADMKMGTIETILGSEDGELDETPCRKVKVNAFFIDRCEVTNEAYQAFIDSTGHTPPPLWNGKDHPKEKAKHPVVGVSFYDASLFAAWRGKRLPTEIEWEAAARGEKARRWPWGDTFEPGLCNIDGDSTTPVGSFPEGVSPFGVMDMAGNVWEWTSSWYNKSRIFERTIRGGSFLYFKFQARTSYREGFNPYSWRNDIGFRCVITAPK